MNRSDRLIAEINFIVDRRTGHIVPKENKKPSLDIRKAMTVLKRRLRHELTISDVDDEELQQMIIDRSKGFRNLNMYLVKNGKGRPGYERILGQVWRYITTEYNVN